MVQRKKNDAHSLEVDQMQRELDCFKKHKFSREQFEALKDPSPNRPKAEIRELLAIEGRIEKKIIKRYYGKLGAHRSRNEQIMAVADLEVEDLDGVAFKPTHDGGKGIDIIEVIKIRPGKYLIHFIQEKDGKTSITKPSRKHRGSRKEVHRSAVHICKNLNKKNSKSIVSIYLEEFENTFPDFTFKVSCSLWTSARVTEAAKELFIGNFVKIQSLQRIWPKNVISVAEECGFQHLLPTTDNRQINDYDVQLFHGRFIMTWK